VDVSNESRNPKLKGTTGAAMVGIRQRNYGEAESLYPWDNQPENLKTQGLRKFRFLEYSVGGIMSIRSRLMKTTGIAFLGAGDVSSLHAEGVRQCTDAKLVGLWNRSPDRGAERAAQFGCKTYPSAEALVSDPEVDAVSVLTNLETHLQYALLAIRAGKHVLVEKPAGNSVHEIEQMKTAA